MDLNNFKLIFILSIYEIASEIFLFFITEILQKSNNPGGIKEETLSNYKDMGDLKKEICVGALRIIADRISCLFLEMKEKIRNTNKSLEHRDSN